MHRAHAHARTHTRARRHTIIYFKSIFLNSAIDTFCYVNVVRWFVCSGRICDLCCDRLWDLSRSNYIIRYWFLGLGITNSFLVVLDRKICRTFSLSHDSRPHLQRRMLTATSTGHSTPTPEWPDTDRHDAAAGPDIRGTLGINPTA